MTNIPKPTEKCSYLPYNHLLTHYTPSIARGESTWNPELQQSFIKYGKKIDFSFEPTYDINTSMAGVNFSYKF